MSVRRFGYIMPTSRDTFDTMAVDRPVDEGSWDEFRKLTRVVEDLRPTAIDFLSLEQEYEEFSRANADICAAWTDANAATIGGMHLGNAYVIAQRRLTNFLGAASAFRSRVDARMSVSQDAGRATAESWKAQVREAYDRSFAYRVLYNLRNYAQHHDSPVSLIPVKGTRRTDGAMEFDVRLMLKGADIAASSRIQSKVRAEINRGEVQEWDLLPLVSEYFRCHSKLMAWLVWRE